MTRHWLAASPSIPAQLLLALILAIFPYNATHAASPSGTTMPNATQIVDARGHVWTQSGRLFYNNGAAKTGPITHLLLYYKNTIYAVNTGNAWYRWTNSSWASAAGNPEPPSASGKTTTPSRTALIDGSGVIWTVAANGLSYENGIADSGANITLLLYYNGIIYANTTSYGWISHGSGGWASISGDPRGLPSSAADCGSIRDGIIGASNGDHRFLCSNGTMYACGWYECGPGCNQGTAIKATDQQVVAGLKCNTPYTDTWVPGLTSKLWIAPNTTSDTAHLFDLPNTTWPRVASRVSVVKINDSGSYSTSELGRRIQALQAQHIDIAIEVESLAGWSCDPFYTAAQALISIQRFRDANKGVNPVKYLEISEPVNHLAECNISMPQAATLTKQFIDYVRNGGAFYGVTYPPNNGTGMPGDQNVIFGQIVGWPHQQTMQVVEWAEDLRNAGVSTPFITLDVDTGMIFANPSLYSFKDLDFLRWWFQDNATINNGNWYNPPPTLDGSAPGTQFGIIFWQSNYGWGDPAWNYGNLGPDPDWYKKTLAFGDSAYAALTKPLDNVEIESWDSTPSLTLPDWGVATFTHTVYDFMTAHLYSTHTP